MLAAPSASMRAAAEGKGTPRLPARGDRTARPKSSSERGVLSYPPVDGWELMRAEVRRFDDLFLGARGRDPSAGGLMHGREVC